MGMGFSVWLDASVKLVVDVAAVVLTLKFFTDIRASSEEVHTLRFNFKLTMASCV